ncbi:MAG: hypothetical protein AAF222_15115 [Pseudomonadota bacterium]
MTRVTDVSDGREIHLIAFAIALFAAPFVVALLTFWVYLIPVFAILFGGPTYLLFGTPVLWLCVRRCGANPGIIALLAFATNLASFIPILLYCRFVLNEPQMAFFIVGFGAVFAPVWGFAFALIYNALTVKKGDASNV